MPDLGKYADAVLSSYAVSIVLIVGLVVLSLRQSAKAQKELADAEARQSTRKSEAP